MSTFDQLRGEGLTPPIDMARFIEHAVNHLVSLATPGFSMGLDPLSMAKIRRKYAPVPGATQVMFTTGAHIHQGSTSSFWLRTMTIPLSIEHIRPFQRHGRP